MNYLLLLPVLLIMVADWYALQTKKIKLGYITKPLVIIAILITAFIQIGNTKFIGTSAGNILWVLIGLAFSLAGDITLMLPKRPFKLGLFLFLLAHIAYNLAITPVFQSSTLAPSIFLAIFFVPVVIFFAYLLQRVMNARKILDLYAPSLLYLIVISSTLYRAISSFFLWKSNPLFSYFAALGAFSMFYADSLLGYRQWVIEHKYTRLISRIFYQLGQLLFAFGVLNHYLSLIQ